MPRTLDGRAGTGGASGAGLTGPFWRPGEGDLNVRSLMEPLLLFLCRPPLPNPARAPLPTTLLLPIEVCEPLRTMRLVWTLPTGSGEVVCDRKAAAAAADERPVWDWDRAMKAWLAAVAAALEVLRSTGWRSVSLAACICASAQAD